MIHLKSDKQIHDMKEGGKRLKDVLQKTLEQVKPGKSTLEIDQFADHLITKHGGEASFKRVEGYKWATCMCVNDCVVHGVPKKDEIIKDGDVIAVDVGMFYKGLNTDTSWTMLVGGKKLEVRSKKDKEIDHFLEIGKKALNKAIKQVKVGKRVGHISKAIQDTIQPEGYGIAEDLIGHGVGKDLHEDPEIPGMLLRPLKKTEKLEIGMTLAVEAIYMMGENKVVTDEADGWTIRTKDGTLSSCFEKTIALTKDGVMVLT